MHWFIPKFKINLSCVQITYQITLLFTIGAETSDKYSNCDVLRLSVIWHHYMCLMSIIYDCVNALKILHLWWLPNVWFEKFKLIKVKGENEFK